jgi:hypothetical protein
MFWKGKPTGDGSCLERSRARVRALGVRFPLLPPVSGDHRRLATAPAWNADHVAPPRVQVRFLRSPPPGTASRLATAAGLKPVERAPRALQVRLLPVPPRDLQDCRSLSSAPSRPATVLASSRPRDPRRARSPWGLGRSGSFYGSGRMARHRIPNPVHGGSIPSVRAIHALSKGNDAAPPARRCRFDSGRVVHLSGSSNG